MRAWDFKLSEFLLEFIHFAVVNSFSKETLEVSYGDNIYLLFDADLSCEDREGISTILRGTRYRSYSLLMLMLSLKTSLRTQLQHTEAEEQPHVEG